ncbi:penicillin-binding protein activator [Vagococcus sp. WN89Y]|uniref:penicillin-binding protein activator n=1 Tax=Vagococcus sp. WN89Y TaxID=3457258 RepID=UPI003FCEA319
MLPSRFLPSKATRCLPVVLAALIFAGCGTQSTDQSASHMQGAAQADSGYYLQQMQQSSDDSKTNWQLLAIRALLNEGKTQRASEVFSQLPQDLNENQRNERALLDAGLKVAQGDAPGAQALLEKIDPGKLEQAQQERYWRIAIAAAQGKPSLTLLRALIAQEPLLTAPAEKQKNIDSTWQALASMSQDEAKTLVINADEVTLQGWLDLQRVWFDNRSDASMLKAGLADWQTRYPQNPGAKMLPTQLANMQNFQAASTNKIALLLPLNGQAAVFGRAIQQGFEAAKNGAAAVSGPAVPTQEAQAATQDVVSPAQANVSDLTEAQQNAAPEASPVQAPDSAAQSAESTDDASTASGEQTTAAASSPTVANAPANPGAELKIYDTSAQPMDQLLNQVQQEGASIIIGPLLKNNVEELMRSQTPLNVLALNQPENVENRANICYFALSPEDEARDAARHIHAQGRQAPLLLVPRSALGERVSNAFAQEWQNLGGGIVLQQKFGSTAELRMGLNSGSGIAMTGSPVTASLPQQQGVTIGGLNIPAPPTDAQISGGGKVDAAYIVATPDEIALLKPMITLRTGSQSNVMLYASSRSAQGGAGPDFRLEMEGLQFNEIPMLAGANPSLMQQALRSVNNDYSLARLYAMGADAWTLANNFSQMRQVPGFELYGNTGDLTANQDCVINRKLSWLKYQQGQIVPAN